MPTDDASGVPIVGPGTPYVVPAQLIAAPTGISWSSIPFRNATPRQQYAEQLNLCVRATAAVDSYCNQPLRATVDTETLTGPGTFRVQRRPNGTGRILLSRSPVTQVVSAQITPAAAFPAAWQTIPATQLRPEKPMLGVYGTSAPSSAGEGGQAVLLGPGWLSAAREGSEVQVVYVNGWPHAALTAAAAAGATAVHIDDITGWPGAQGIIYDPDGQEVITVTAVTPTVTGAICGPGTLTVGALAYAHQPGTVTSTLPGAVQQASILFATVQALTRGTTATTVQASPGRAVRGRGEEIDDLIKQAKGLLNPYRRVI